jgi:hypothetical protein
MSDVAARGTEPIDDLTKHPRLAWVADILARAKGIMKEQKGSLEPMLFCLRPEGDGRALIICPLVQLGDINDEEQKDTIAAGMRVACRHTRATQCVFLTDVFSNVADPGDEEAAAALMDAAKYRNLSDEMKRRVRRREAILAVVESADEVKATGLIQYYRRERDGSITFEEVVQLDGMAGRFGRLLPHPETETAEFQRAMVEEAAAFDEGDSPAKLAAWFRKYGRALGWAVVASSERIDILRADGSRAFRLERARTSRPELFDQLRDAFRGDER